MKRYVVATVNFFDNEIIQTIQEAESKLEAVKKHMLDLTPTLEIEKEEQEWQDSEDYPKTFEEFIEQTVDWEMDCSVIEI